MMRAQPGSKSIFFSRALSDIFRTLGPWQLVYFPKTSLGGCCQGASQLSVREQERELMTYVDVQDSRMYGPDGGQWQSCKKERKQDKLIPPSKGQIGCLGPRK